MLRVRGSRSALGGLVTVAVLGLTACSGSSPATGAGAAGAGGAMGVDSAKGDALLQQSATGLRAAVDALIPVAKRAKPPYVACKSAAGSGVRTGGDLGIPCSGFDDKGPCEGDDAERLWPQRWGYNLNLQLAADDANATGKVIRTALSGSGWKVTPAAGQTGGTDNSAMLTFTAVKGGTRVEVVTDAMPGVLTIEGYGPCIEANGAVRTTP
jgi:hypothetical protein